LRSIPASMLARAPYGSWRRLSDLILANLFTTRGLTHNVLNRNAEAAMYYNEAIRRGKGAEIRGVLRARANLTEILLSQDANLAVEIAREVLADGKRLGSRTPLQVVTPNFAEALILTGEWDEAAAPYDEAESFGLGDDPYFAPIMLMLRTHRGDVKVWRPCSPCWSRLRTSRTAKPGRGTQESSRS
jgi:hypothetical protein